MTGWRIGFTIANETWTKAMVKLQSHSATHPTSFVQYACAKGFEQYDQTIDAVKAMTAEYERRKNWLIPALNEIEGFKCAMPEGAFYAFVDVGDLVGGEFRSSGEVSDHLLRKGHIVVTDGAPFGADGHIRISYATSMDDLQKAVSTMKELFGSATAVAA
jgi:aspartate aminotransferase